MILFLKRDPGDPGNKSINDYELALLATILVFDDVVTMNEELEAHVTLHSKRDPALAMVLLRPGPPEEKQEKVYLPIFLVH
jgi:hypothetical protein